MYSIEESRVYVQVGDYIVLGSCKSSLPPVKVPDGPEPIRTSWLRDCRNNVRNADKFIQ